MKTILFFTVILVFSAAKVKAQAKAHFPEMIHDFDTLTQYGKCQHDFMLINTGDEPLVIANVKTSCGCDVPNWDKEPVLPGDTTYVNYKYDSKRIGPINKTMTIQSNDPENPVIVVRVKGLILPKEEQN